jgi:hypothetical protein
MGLLTSLLWGPAAMTTLHCATSRMSRHAREPGQATGTATWFSP